MDVQLSVVIPARNEAVSLRDILPAVRTAVPDAEVIVVDDGSTDDTAKVAAAEGAVVVSHPYGMGNGAAIKSGVRAARGDLILFMDADGQHHPQDIPKLVSRLQQGYEMVVGARSRESQASLGRFFANSLYNRLASWIVGHRVEDLTSGFRIARTSKFREFLDLLPNGFSYPTTITMAFFRAGYPVAYVPIVARTRTSDSKSHVRLLSDGMRFLVIIFRVGSLYSPLKVFLPFSLVYLALGLGYYAYTYMTEARFTNMGALLLTVAVLIFLIGLVSEQITSLLYVQRKID